MASSQNDLWLNKAIGFVTRARQEMWGKHNTDIMAFLFEYGLSNATAKEYLLGWNRRGKFRSAESWGLNPDEITSEEGKIVFPEGIVVPYIVEEQLKKITIVMHKKKSAGQNHHVITGSQPVSMILGDTNSSDNDTYVIENILDGIYLLQELKLNEENKQICLIIPHDLSARPDNAAEKQLDKAGKVIFLTRGTQKPCELWMKNYDNSESYIYRNPEELINKIQD